VSPWELIGWAIAVPLITLSVLFVYAVSVAVVRAIVTRGKRQPSETVSKGRHLKAVD
jgi:hypothetical protein